MNTRLNLDEKGPRSAKQALVGKTEISVEDKPLWPLLSYKLF